MTKDELKKEAEEYARSKHKERLSRWEQIQVEDVENAFIDGYHECQKEHEWHLMSDCCPSVDILVRVLTYSNEEYICETQSYYPSEDEIGYGHEIVYFYELNGDWVDSCDIKAWCELQPVPKELKEIE